MRAIELEDLYISVFEAYGLICPRGLLDELMRIYRQAMPLTEDQV